MIDSTLETVFPLSEAPEHLPRRRRGRKVHISTLHRWATVGCKGVRLETINVGATKCTSREGLQRFFEAITSRTGGTVSATSAPPRRSAAKRRRDSERAEAVLKGMGA